MALNLQMKNGNKSRLREKFPGIGKARKESGCKTSDPKLTGLFPTVLLPLRRIFPSLIHQK